MTELDKSKIVYQGYFEKIGAKVKSWKRRLFVISDSKLYYFKDPAMTEALGVIPLIDTTITNEPVTDDPGYYFMLRFPPTSTTERKEYLFRTQKEEERTTWSQEIMKANKVTIFGRILQQALKVNPDNFSLQLPIPYFITPAIKYIEENAMDIEGIYRLNGSASIIESLQNQINSNGPVEFTDPHATTGLVKLYLRTLPEPLLLESNYNSLKAIGTFTEEKKVPALSKILRSLPISNYILVYYIFSHLVKLLEHESTTKMTIQALSVCIGPSICRAVENTAAGAYDESNVQQIICGVLFEHFGEIFGPNPLMMYGSAGESSIAILKTAQQEGAPFALDVPVGSIVQSVAEDQYGWSICVCNQRWGVVHKDYLDLNPSPRQVLAGLGEQSDKWQLDDVFLGQMSVKCPEALQLYEALNSKLRELRGQALCA